MFCLTIDSFAKKIYNKTMMHINLPPNVLTILNTLTNHGHKAFVVGGSLRDSLSGKPAKDWDIASSALPEEVMALFAKTVPTGISHGTVTVLLGKEPFEVTTFRIDGDYRDNRHPERVTFTRDIEEDLSRRDFTMNAMAYHPETGLVDPFGGQKDIEDGVIRCVGDPDTRYREDALRMLRALRFAAQTGFRVEKETLSAIGRQKHLIQNVSSERVRDELVKLLLSDRPEQLMLLKETELLPLVLPELALCFKTPQRTKYHIYDVGQHTVEAVKHTPPELVLRLSALLHDIGKPAKKTTDEAGVDHFKGHHLASCDLAEDILTRLRFDNATKKAVLTLVHHHDRQIEPTPAAVKRAMNKVGADLFLPLLTLKRADALSQNPAFGTPRLSQIETLKALYHEVLSSGEAFSKKDLAISGNDLLALGLSGKEIGTALDFALEFVLEHPEDNTKEILLKQIESELLS